jgi:hypothetical protein
MLAIPFPLFPSGKGGLGGFSLPYLQLFLECSFHHKIEARTAHGGGRIPETNHSIGDVFRFVILTGFVGAEKKFDCSNFLHEL